MNSLEKNISQQESIQRLIAQFNKKILTLSHSQINSIAIKLYSENEYDFLKELIVEIQKQRENYLQQRLNRQFTFFRTIMLWIIILAVLSYLYYFISMHYHVPQQKELYRYIKQLEHFGITFIQSTQNIKGYFEKIGNQTTLTEPDYYSARYLMDHIRLIDENLKWGWFIWVERISSSLFIAGTITLARYILRFIFSKEKYPDKQYLLLEQKLHDMMN